MSLLMDARKKSQQALSAPGEDAGHSGLELSLEEYPGAVPAKPGPQPVAAPPDATSSINSARSAGKNLLSAKSPAAQLARTGGINRNLLRALVGTVFLLAAGAGYVWYLDSAVSNQPLQPRAPTAAAAVASTAEPDPATPQNSLVASTPASADSAQHAKLKNGVPHKKAKPSPQPGTRIVVKPQQTEPLDSLIGNAYLAYRNGKLDEARLMYLEVLGAEEPLAGHPKDARNTDALLGLAAISQQLGEDNFAAQYYLRVLTLDPRNAVANAGMSALNMNEDSESRLKALLREQRDSAALHFALGNIYAAQSRWGEAQSAYFNAYTLDSKDAGLAFNLAVSLDHLGQNKLASQYYQRALQLEGEGQQHGIDHEQISQRVKELTR